MTKTENALLVIKSPLKPKQKLVSVSNSVTNIYKTQRVKI